MFCNLAPHFNRHLPIRSLLSEFTIFGIIGKSSKILKRACISRVLELLRILSIFNRHLLIEISARHQQIRRSELSESLKVVPVFFRPRKEHNSVTRFQFPFSRINWTLEVSTLIWLNFFASIRHLTAF